MILAFPFLKADCPVNLQKIFSQQARLHYDNQAQHYRAEGDRKARLSPAYHKYFDDLSSLCEKLGERISVLDLGCGTGRYFSCLKNVSLLVGLDLSVNMLKEAKEALRTVSPSDLPRVLLINGDVHKIDFLFSKSQRFDLIYSIGTFAEYTPLNSCDLDAMYQLLAEGGYLYLTTVHWNPTLGNYLRRVCTKAKAFTFSKLAKGRPVEQFFPTLYSAIARKKIDYSLLYLSHGHLLKRLHRSKFSEFAFELYTDTKHTHEIIIARKPFQVN